MKPNMAAIAEYRKKVRPTLFKFFCHRVAGFLTIWLKVLAHACAACLVDILQSGTASRLMFESHKFSQGQLLKVSISHILTVIL